MKIRVKSPDSNSSQSLAIMEREGALMPIVFLHGNSFCKEVFSQLFNEKSLSEHRLISLDLPGHGASEDAKNPADVYSFRGLAKTVQITLDKLGLDRCVIAGWSLGGHVAFELVHDPRVAGIFAFGAPPAPNGPIGLLNAFHFNRTLLLAGKSKFTEADAAYFARVTLCDLDGTFVEPILRTDQNFRANLSRSILYRRGESQLELVQSSPAPIALVNGEHDILVRQKYMARVMCSPLWREHAITLSNCGHASFMENPKMFTRLLKQFTDDASSNFSERSKALRFG